MSQTFESGDTADVLLETGGFGALLPGDDSPAPNCGLDPQRDIAFPWSVTITNTNDGFDQVLNFAWYPQNAGSYVFAADRGQGDGCIPGDDMIPCQSVEAVSPGESVTCSGYFVWRDALSPASPDIASLPLSRERLVMGSFDGSSLGKGTYRLSADPMVFGFDSDGSLLAPYYFTMFDATCC